MLTPTLLLLLALLLLLLALLIHHALPTPIPGIPHNPSAPRTLLGDLPSLISSNLPVTDWALQQTHAHRSPIVQMFVKPFSKPKVIIADYREALDIVVRRNREFDRADDLIDALACQAPLFHINLKTQDPRGAWKRHRRLVRDLMLRPFLERVAAPGIWHAARELLGLWGERKGQGCFEAGDDLRAMMLDAIMRTTFGEGEVPGEALKGEGPVGGFVDAIYRTAEFTDKLCVAAYPRWLYRFTMWPWESRYARIREAVIRKRIRKAVDRLDEVGEGNEQDSVIGMMVMRERGAAKKEGRRPEYESRTVIDEVSSQSPGSFKSFAYISPPHQIIGFFFAGHETTSAAFTWAVKYLARAQTSQTRLRNALKEAYPTALSIDRLPTTQEILSAHIPYLDATIHEILRCAIPIPFAVRQTTCDAPLMGHVIPKDTTIFIPLRGPGYEAPSYNDPKNTHGSSGQPYSAVRAWDDEDGAFRPERWLDDEGECDVSGRPSMPFSAGLRGCYGRRLVVLQLRVALTVLVLGVEVLRVPGEVDGEESVDGLARRPRRCFVRLRKTGFVD
ncbi:hypothetical protein PRZ48_013805 [Zasmidium cellare]|uniref:Cytochrome P450 n=1 Tax=Zasmidium cellare TaxID=395010 RepID=A0ABR0E225_ZASCE|nr:hypothetical protein PRZ48_013805 [Zasmidium cellare]